MQSSKAYDLPIRIFHWVFAILFLISFSIAKFIDDDSMLYAYHMLSGILMVSLVILRVIWGLVGSKTSRFSSYKLRPTELFEYLNSILTTRSKRYLGHNPASSYAAILMLLLTVGIGLSGLMMSLRINKHFFEEVHELMANGLLIVVIFHIAGVIFHQARHADGMIFSMVNGKKNKIDGENEIKSNHPIAAVILILFILCMSSYLFINFDNNSGKLATFGTQLQLGENEDGKYEEDRSRESTAIEDEHEDDD